MFFNVPSALCWQEKFENATLFVRLGLPPTLFRYSSNWRTLKTELFKSDDITAIMWYTCPSYNPQTQIQNSQWFLCNGIVWRENILSISEWQCWTRALTHGDVAYYLKGYHYLFCGNWRPLCKKGVYRFFGRFSFFAGSS